MSMTGDRILRAPRVPSGRGGAYARLLHIVTGTSQRNGLLRGTPMTAATATSQRMAHVGELLAPIYRFFATSAYSRRAGNPTICDFVAGNPQEMALEGFVAALQRWSVPQDKNWFAYKN